MGDSEDENKASRGEWMRSVSNVFDILRLIWGTFSFPCRPLDFAQAPHLRLNSVPWDGRTTLCLLFVTLTWTWPLALSISLLRESIWWLRFLGVSLPWIGDLLP